ncbi:MAG: NAD(P)H-dependent oxidoreductase [Candidatus Pacebacteria bacterium]|nr:NAD(P)H-dependent oxidoreductase [Candidatus Paceibacterota bacterium]
MKNILVLLGNPDTETFSGKIADTYEAAAQEAGHEVFRMNIGAMQFDPILHAGYKEIQELEPDLLLFQEKVKWADHIVVVYPNWWCTMPAALKGLFDRSWLPGFAFNFSKENGKLMQRLTGKTARAIIVAGSHSPFMTWWKFGDFTNEIAHGILGFAGIKTKVTAFGPTNKMSDRKSEVCLAYIEKIASKGR